MAYFDNEGKWVRAGKKYINHIQSSKDLASQCFYDKIIVLVKRGISGWSWSSENIAISTSCDHSVDPPEGYNKDKLENFKCSTTDLKNQQMLTVHEFAHTFGLYDMYLVSSDIYSGFNIEKMPNCDTIGCPKWCDSYDDSNYLKAQTECSKKLESECRGGIFTIYDDQGNYKESQYWCYWMDEECRVGEGYEDIGINCLEGSGCYNNCGGPDRWRPVKRGTIMLDDVPSEDNPDFDKFDPISLKYLNEYFEQFR